MEICSEWHSFILESKENLKVDPSGLELDNSTNIEQWSVEARNKIEDLFYFLDAILLKCPEIFNLKSREDIKNAALISLFTIMNYNLKEFFPLHHADRTYLLLIFNVFMGKRLSKSEEDKTKYWHQQPRRLVESWWS